MEWNGIVPGYIHKMFKPSLCRYSTRSQMILDIPLWKTNTGQRSLSFLRPKIWFKIDASIKSLRTSSSFMHAIKKSIYFICKANSNYCYILMINIIISFTFQHFIFQHCFFLSSLVSFTVACHILNF